MELPPRRPELVTARLRLRAAAPVSDVGSVIARPSIAVEGKASR